MPYFYKEIHFQKPVQLTLSDLAKQLKDVSYSGKSEYLDKESLFVKIDSTKPKLIFELSQKTPTGFRTIASRYRPEEMAILLKHVPKEVLQPIKSALVGTALELPEISENFELPEYPIISIPKLNDFTDHIKREIYTTQLIEKFEIKSTAIDQPKFILCAGLKGIGKSDLVLGFTHEIKAQHKLWFDAHDKDTLLNAYRKFYDTELGSDYLTDEDLLLEIQYWFKTHKNWLVVYDNILNYKEIEPCLPKKGLGTVIFTSCLQPSLAFKNQYKLSTITINEFSHKEAIKLCEGILRIDESEEDVTMLHKALSYHPQALVQASYFIRKLSVSINRYFELYQSNKLYLKKVDGPVKNQSVYDSLCDNINLLSKQALSPEYITSAHALLVFCATQNSHIISISSIEAWLKSNNFSSAVTVDKLLDCLISCSLVTIDADRIKMLPLLQDVIVLQSSSLNSKVTSSQLKEIKLSEQTTTIFHDKKEIKTIDKLKLKKQFTEELIKAMQKVNATPRNQSGVWYYDDYYTYCEQKEIPFEKEYQFGYANSEYWKHDNLEFFLKKGKKASDAIQDFLNGFTIADCGNIIVACQYAALLKIFGEDNFNLYFNDTRRIYIPQLTFTANASFYDLAALRNGFAKGSLGNRPLQLGDMCHISGVRDYSIKHPAGNCGGFNVIFVGKNKKEEDLFLGFDPILFREKSLTERELYKVFIQRYNLERNLFDKEIIRLEKNPEKYSMEKNRLPEIVTDEETEKYIGGFCAAWVVTPDFANIEKQLLKFQNIHSKDIEALQRDKIKLLSNG